MRKHIPSLLTGCLIVAICLWLSAPGAFGQDAASPCPLPPDGPTCKERLADFWYNLYGGAKVCKQSKDFKWKLLAKAKPDECFQGIGNPKNLNDPSTGLGFLNNYPKDLNDAQIASCYAIDPPDQYPVPDTYAQPKVNQAYVWGLVQARDKCNDPLDYLWFGTISNVHCLVIQGFLQQSGSSMNPSWVCEGSQSALRDSRPPRAYYYCTKSKKLVEVTQDIIAGGCFPPDTVTDAQLLQSTIGLRSAGSAREVVFLGGIGLRGINLFAFDARTKQYLGAKNFPQYNNIRQWRLVKDRLYVGVGKDGGGEVLRWTGRKSCCADELFCFEKVGELVGEIAGDPAYLTEHQGRLYVSTWPSFSNGDENGSARPMSILRSPCFGKDKKLTWEDADKWEKVWDYSQYDPEYSAYATTGGGALMSYEGCLYWGTMHVPGLSLLAWNGRYGQNASQEDQQAALLGTYRPISIFRGCCLDKPGKEKIELLYGFSCLPEYVPGNTWQLVRNKMDQDPKFGLGGFDNFFNNYTWWAEVFKDKLFFGTMDFLYLGGAMVRDEYQFPEKITQLFELFYGADLWAFRDTKRPAFPVSRSGVGNYANYGIRTMVSTPSALYLGSANPMNLMTDPTDDRPEGGWELIKLFK